MVTRGVCLYGAMGAMEDIICAAILAFHAAVQCTPHGHTLVIEVPFGFVLPARSCFNSESRRSSLRLALSGASAAVLVDPGADSRDVLGTTTRGGGGGGGGGDVHWDAVARGVSFWGSGWHAPVSQALRHGVGRFAKRCVHWFAASEHTEPVRRSTSLRAPGSQGGAQMQQITQLLGGTSVGILEQLIAPLAVFVVSGLWHEFVCVLAFSGMHMTSAHHFVLTGASSGLVGFAADSSRRVCQRIGYRVALPNVMGGMGTAAAWYGYECGGSQFMFFLMQGITAVVISLTQLKRWFPLAAYSA